jgi:hypothetical protein
MATLAEVERVLADTDPSTGVLVVEAEDGDVSRLRVLADRPPARNGCAVLYCLGADPMPTWAELQATRSESPPTTSASQADSGLPRRVQPTA